MNIKHSDSNLILFSAQIMIIFIVICVSLLNLTLQWGNINLWIILLTSSLGYLMPNPKFKNNKTSFSHNNINLVGDHAEKGSK